MTLRKPYLVAGLAILATAISYSSPLKASDSPEVQVYPDKRPEEPQINSEQPSGLIRTHCWTNARDCAGLAVFINRSSTQYVSCSVYFDNGRRGISNFVIEPKHDHKIHVRGGDTQACVAGRDGVPVQTRRSWIWVE